MATIPSTSLLESVVKYQKQPLHSLLHQAAVSSKISETVPAAFTILFDLLNTPDLADNPLLHATTHTLMALNIPLYSVDNTMLDKENKPQKLALKDSTGVYWKSVYLTEAEDILSDLIRERHAHGQCKECKQYAEFINLQSAGGTDIWKTNLKDDGSECNSVVRLEKILERERALFNEEISHDWDRIMRTEWHMEGKGG